MHKHGLLPLRYVNRLGPARGLGPLQVQGGAGDDGDGVTPDGNRDDGGAVSILDTSYRSGTSLFFVLVIRTKKSRTYLEQTQIEGRFKKLCKIESGWLYRTKVRKISWL